MSAGLFEQAATLDGENDTAARSGAKRSSVTSGYAGNVVGQSAKEPSMTIS